MERSSSPRWCQCEGVEGRGFVFQDGHVQLAKMWEKQIPLCNKEGEGEGEGEGEAVLR